jgi:hypothetical protein
MRKFFAGAARPLFAASLVLLTACSKQAPQCADAAARDSIRKYMDESVIEALRYQGVDSGKDSEGVIAKYLASWGFELSNVTSNGYDEKSRTRSCQGHVSITIPDTGQRGYVDLSYSMQMLEDGKSGGFELGVSHNYQVWAYGAAAPVLNFYRAHGSGAK